MSRLRSRAPSSLTVFHLFTAAGLHAFSTLSVRDAVWHAEIKRREGQLMKIVAEKFHAVPKPQRSTTRPAADDASPSHGAKGGAA